jgi:hypothetical protein
MPATTFGGAILLGVRRTLLLALLACGPAEKPVTTPVEILAVPPMPTASPPTVEAPSPPPMRAPRRFDGPAPTPDFTAFGDVVAAASRSVGKIARLRVRRDHYTSAKQFTAVPCVDRVPNATIWLRYVPEDRDWVRAMHDTPHDACATVSFKVVAFRPPPAPLVEGTIEHVATLEPKPPEPAPPGADYASVDDAIIDGADAKGKIIATEVWAYDSDPTELWVHDCKRRDAFVFVRAKSGPQKALASLLSTSPGRCATAHLLLAEPTYVSKMGNESMQRPRSEVVSVP